VLLRGEQIRISAVSLCALFVAISAFVRVSLTKHGFGVDEFPIVASILILAFLGYEATSLFLLRWRVARGKRRSQGKAWFDSFLEGALPFVLGAAVIIDTFVNPYIVISGQLVTASLLIVILSVLRLNPWMCLASGGTAIVSYVALVLWVHATVPVEDFEGYVYPRAFFPIATGLLIGGTALAILIAAQSRIWLQAAWEASENIRMRKEVERELQLASDVQRELLPRDWPDGGVFDVAAASRPAGRLGGDFYDWMSVTGDGVLMCLADVTGHGAASAMLGAECRAYCRAVAPNAADLPDLLVRLEELLMLDLRSGSFVTMVFLLLDTRAGRMQVLSAGQGPILIVRSDGAFEEIEVHRPPLGVPGSNSVESSEIDLAEGDILVVISDGILDRINERGEDLGIERFLELLRELDFKSARSIVDGVFESTDSFAGETAAPDDASVMVIRRSVTNAGGSSG
jgi:serine phosphatase RsbU (regulator of sigma subunit)